MSWLTLFFPRFRRQLHVLRRNGKIFMYVLGHIKWHITAQLIILSLFVTAALRALQILSSSVQANFTDTVPTVSPSINGSCFGESEWIPLNKLPR